MYANSRLIPLTLDHRDEYVIGYPIHVAITATNSIKQTILCLLPHASVFDPGVGVRVGVEDGESGARLASPGPPYAIESEDGEGCFELRYDERRRMLTDISSLVPRSLSAGTYVFSVQYGAPHAYATARTAPVRLRLPD
jgi:hypothetical protein